MSNPQNSKELYRTKKGAYFVYKCGGLFDEFSEVTGNLSEQNTILPLENIEVIPWLEKHGGAEVLIRDFADELEEA